MAFVWEREFPEQASLPALLPELALLPGLVLLPALGGAAGVMVTSGRGTGAWVGVGGISVGMGAGVSDGAGAEVGVGHESSNGSGAEEISAVFGAGMEISSVAAAQTVVAIRSVDKSKGTILFFMGISSFLDDGYCNDS